VEASPRVIAAIASLARDCRGYAGRVTVVWVTGNSGTGKSTVCGVLRARGYLAFDADEDGFSRWIDRSKGEVVMDPPYPVPEGWLERYGWVIVRERVEALVEESRSRIAFLCGSAENEEDVRELFDVTVCLVIDEDTLRHRLATRTTNAFGQHPEELAAALEWNPRMRAIYEGLGATVIDATKPVTEVVGSVIDAVQALRGGA
jgi:shikimate kinase